MASLSNLAGAALPLLLAAATLPLRAAPADPVIFAPGTISSPAYELTPTFTPDGNTCYFLRFGVGLRDGTIMESHLVDGRWTEARPVAFSGRYADSAPSLSPDGSRLFFASKRPLPGEERPSRQGHLWVVQHLAEGWSEPQPLPAPVLNPSQNQSSPSVTATGTLYFTVQTGPEQSGWDIYRARWVDGAYAAPERVPHVSTRYDEPWVSVSTDESLLLFSGTRRPDTLGESDLYLARHWDKNFPELEVRSLREPINSPAEEICPRLAPDGRAVFFTRNGDIYRAELDAPATAAGGGDDPCWVPKAPLLHARQWPQAVVAGGRVYVYGGLDRANAWVNVAEEYDPAENRWRQLPAVPAGWERASLVAIGERVLLLQRGGTGVAEYDRTSDQWKTIPGDAAAVAGIYDEPPFRIRVAVVGNRIFTLRNQDGGTGDDDLSSFAEFDLAQQRWIERASPPIPAIQLVTHAGRIYAFGGGTRASSVAVYDPAANTWSPKAPLRIGRWEAAVASLGDKIYLIGGHRMVNGDVHDTVEEYEPALDRWNAHPQNRRWAVQSTAVTLGETILLIGGRSLDNGRVLRDVADAVVEFRPTRNPALALVPRLFAPGVISTPADETSSTSMPDGRTVYFGRHGDKAAIMVSRLCDGRWSAPEKVLLPHEGSDFYPALSADGQQLYFTSDRPVAGKPAAPGDYDLWVSTWREGAWSPPENLGAPINTSAGEVYCSVAANGTLYFGSGKDGRHILVSRRVDGAYTEPEKLPDSINTPAFEGYHAVARDESFLVFTSNRPGGEGGQDLYISQRRDGMWSEPRNLGPLINTAANESHARLSADGRTLYFASDRDYAHTTFSAETAGLTEAELRSILDGRNRNLFEVDLEALLASLAPGSG